MQKRFSGVVVPMITPLKKDFTVDVEAVAVIMKRFAQYGIHPLVLGTTGESSSVDEKESLRFVKAAVDAKSQGQCVYAGLVGNQVAELIRRGNQYIELGADVVVSTLPTYYILTHEQMVAFYTQLADNVKGPVMVYNIKATTQMSIPMSVIAQLSHHSNIWGLKDSERDAVRMQECIATYKDRADFSYFCGWGAQSFGSLQLGADGVVPSTGNIVPELYGKLMAASLQEDWKTAEYYQDMTDKVALVYQKDRTLGESLASLKVLMNRKNLCGKTMMPPLGELSEEWQQRIITEYEALKKELI